MSGPVAGVVEHPAVFESVDVLAESSPIYTDDDPRVWEELI